MYNTAFNREQFDSIYPPGIENHYWNHCRNRIIYDVLKKHSLLKSSILEIGCGRGIVVDYLNSKKVTIEGCELAPVPIDKRLKGIVHTGTNAIGLPEVKRKKIEVILLLDVIEHIENPDAFLKEIIVAFQNAKHLIITVPACRELWSNYDEFNGHFRRYNKKMLSEHAENLTWNVKKCRYLYHALYLPARMLVKMKKQRNVILKAPHGFSLFIHKIISLLFFSEYKIIPGGIKGTSLLLYLYKPDQ